MPVEAFVQTGERTVLSYLTKPRASGQGGARAEANIPWGPAARCRTAGGERSPEGGPQVNFPTKKANPAGGPPLNRDPRAGGGTRGRAPLWAPRPF